MAATVNAEFARWKTRDVVGADEKQFALYQVILDGTYVAGGEPVDFTSLAPFTTVDAVFILGHDSGVASLGYSVDYDESAGKIRVFDGGADGDPFDEVGAIDLSAFTVNVMVLGDE
jgi:hypothetical protein|tara:strand:- start:1857 stop:2204 length:348 start_codon:yes stop_codon:yes gene_type:complete